MIFDDTSCSLGEGVFWHPKRQSLFWFDINNMRMFERKLNVSKARIWQFDELVSAAGWISFNELLIASETALFMFNLESQERCHVISLEADNVKTRSNDGRADPYGGFWIGTMGKNAEDKAGAIYRYFDGACKKLFDHITISNSICFSPSGDLAYFTDTQEQIIMSVGLDEMGWPIAEPKIFVDLREEGLNPDGSVVDVMGNLWNAQWGVGRVACYDPKGRFLEKVEFSASQISCPAFGGVDHTILFATSAGEGLENKREIDGGKVFMFKGKIQGQKEHKVKIRS